MTTAQLLAHITQQQHDAEQQHFAEILRQSQSQKAGNGK